MAVSEVNIIIKQLEKNELCVIDVPAEISNDPKLVAFERKTGLRITGERGFDIISDSFFVEEELCYDNNGETYRKTLISSFDDFGSYYTYLNGDIFENACYAFHHIPDEELLSRGINPARLSERTSLTDDVIENYSLEESESETEEYKTAEQIHKQCQKWIRKFNACTSYQELEKVTKNYRKSSLFATVDLSFFFFNYVFSDLENRDRFDIIMEYMSSGAYPEYKLIRPLCSIYHPSNVLDSYHYSSGSKQTKYRNKKALKDYVCRLENGEIEFVTGAYFDKTTHYYCEKTCGYLKDDSAYPVAIIERYFESFEAFISYRNGDLTNCDLSATRDLHVDFSQYATDKTTRLPISERAELNYSVYKYYDYGTFDITQQWTDKFDNVIKEYEHSFSHFFDCVAFLHGDLSNANLLFCDGLANLRTWDNINFAGAKLTSSLCRKFGLEYKEYRLKTDLIGTFAPVEKSETETALVQQASRNLIDEAFIRDLSEIDIAFDKCCQKVHYISDLHLMHRVQKADCQSVEDVECTVQHIVDTLAEETGRLLLIAGDVASDFELYTLFVETLSYSLEDSTLVVFTLGNHELWSFPSLPLDEIVEKYRSFLVKHNMFLLHNDVLYREDNWYHDHASKGTHVIPYRDLCEMENNQLTEQLKSARYVILGGLGFSGYNTEFNADNGIYRGTLDRAQEIEESKRFEELYLRLSPILCKKNSIVMTHTPKKDWCESSEPDQDLIYISGHTHRNYFYDDSIYRVYADNQIGYRNDNPHLKSLLMDNEYDCFDNYPDGIFEITREQYRDFYRGKNIQMTFDREINALFMLKKAGYYCFLHETKKGQLSILNGGIWKNIPVKSKQEAFDRMDGIIAAIKSPLDKYSAVQRKISNAIKRIGGVGKIHGCIIDIDFCNHIYVNPMDSTITGYWAKDVFYKIVYPSVLLLLEEHCPECYRQYLCQCQGGAELPAIIEQPSEINGKPQIYLDTVIYKASREIKKIQKLYSNILSVWYDDQTQGGVSQIELT